MKIIRGTLSFTWEIFKIVLIALLIVIPIRYFIFQPFFVRGQSMEPNFHDGDYLIIDEISYKIGEPVRGEVVVFKYPGNPTQRYIKRIIGLPGETIEIKNGKITISNNTYNWVLNESFYLSESIQTQGDVTISLGEYQYFVLGDNRDASFDSRRWGPLPREDIIGRVIFRAWPMSALAKIEMPSF